MTPSQNQFTDSLNVFKIPLKKLKPNKRSKDGALLKYLNLKNRVNYQNFWVKIYHLIISKIFYK